MKKLYEFALLLVVMLSCMLFSACGDQFKNLSMSFTYLDQPISQINLVMPDEQDDKDSFIDIAIKFSGISKDKVGDVEIYSNPIGLVSNSDYRVQGTTCYVRLQAYKVGKGSLIAKHLSTNKTVSIPISVDKASKDVEIVDATYVVTIPDSQVKTYNFFANEIVKLVPEDSTDNIHLKLAEEVNKKGLLVNKNDLGYVTGVTITNELEANTTIKLYPITQIYNVKQAVEYKDKVFSVKFIKSLTQDDIKIATDEAHTYTQDGNECLYQPIVLVAGDLSSGDKEKYSYNNFIFDVDFDADLQNYYKVEVENNNDCLTVLNTDKGFVVQAVDYCQDQVEVFVKLKPINCVGDIKEIVKPLTFRAYSKQSALDIFMANELLTNTQNVELYDNYFANGQRVLGELFRFDIVQTYAMPEANNVRLVVSPQILNASLADVSGINPVVKSEEDNTLLTSAEFNAGVGKNINLLEFYLKNGQRISFTYNKAENLLYSQRLRDNESVYIKYSKNLDGEQDLTLALKVQTYYSGNLEYLQGISTLERVITFNSQVGVLDFDVSVGKLTASGSGGSFSAQLIKDENNPQNDTSITNVYLNNLDQANDVKYFMDLSNVVGADGDIDSAEFNISVKYLDGSLANKPLKMRLNKNEVSESKIYQYSVSKGYESYLLFDYIGATVGNYEVKISHGNGTYKTINVLVYQPIMQQNMDYNIAQLIDDNPNNDVIANKQIVEEQVEYIYPDYQVDYIACVGQNVDINILLKQYQLSFNHVVGYKFSMECDAGNILDYVKLDDVRLDAITKNNTLSIQFVKGTYQGGIKKITANLAVISRRYKNIATVDDDYDESLITIEFYVYEKIDNKTLSLNETEVTRYAESKLGAYYLDLSTLMLDVSIIDNNLWNYVDKIALPDTMQDGDLGVMGQVDPQTNKAKEYSVKWWYINRDTSSQNSSTIVDAIMQTDKSIKLSFDSFQNSVNDVVIYAQVYQFGQALLPLSCVVHVKMPVLTQTISGNVYNSQGVVCKVKDNKLNLRCGQTYTLQYVCENSNGEILWPDVYLVVVDQYGYTNTNTIAVDNINKTFRIIDGALLEDSLRLLVLAKDNLKSTLGTSSAGFNDLSNYLINPNAYLMFDLVLSDGSEANRYWIQDVNDFCEALSNPQMANKHYILKQDLDLSNIDYNYLAVTDFSGSIISEQGNCIYGVKLNNNRLNLLETLSGYITNVQFDVSYNYNLTSSKDIYLGLIGHLTSTLTNVTVNISGNVNIKSLNASTAYFGGLVAENSGEILHNVRRVGVSGNININSQAKAYFGGLVGCNIGTISSLSWLNDANKSGFAVTVEDQSAISNLIITASVTESARDESYLGGLIGLNNCGLVKDIFVTGSINADTFNNVGGVIGCNLAGDRKTTITSSIEDITTEADSTLLNVKSAVKILAHDYVGGIVGVDKNGVYENCRYQIFADAGYGVKGSKYVAGLIGCAENSYLEYCSVYSYKWNYNDILQISGTADIIGGDYVAGLIGKSVSQIENVGADDVISNCVTSIKNCSINASLDSTSRIAGLIALTVSNNAQIKEQKSVALNAYFLGKTLGTLSGTKLSCDNTLAYNSNVYFNDSNIKLTEIFSGAWGYNENINGGNIYILAKDSTQPIFDVAPNKIDAVVADTNKHIKVSDKVIHLDYYNFNLSTSDTNFAQLNNTYNVYSVINDSSSQDIKIKNGIMTFSYEPNNIATDVRLKVESTNPSILQVTADGMIQVMRPGSCQLIFSSVLNPNVKDVVDVEISYPLAKKYTITDSTGKQVTDEHISVNKGKLYVITPSVDKMYGYEYLTNQDVKYKVTVSGVENINDYLSISGLQMDENNSLILDKNTPFSISVLHELESGNFNISVTPYLIIGAKETKTIEATTQSFVLETYSGVNSVAMDYDSIVLYPNDETVLTLLIETDKQCEISAYYSDELLSIIELSNELDGNIQKIQYKVQVIGNVDVEQLSSITFNVFDGIKTLTESINLTIYTQRINKIEIKNYIDSNANNMGSTLRPDASGLMIIDIVPGNGNYAYVEISDISGNEEVVFSQITDINGTLYPYMPSTSNDGKGIRLQGNQSRFYVLTKISKDYSSKKHLIKVTAYSKQNVELCYGYYYLDVKMLPSAIIQLRDPDGYVKATIDSKQSTDTYYIANGVDTTFRFTTKNSDGTILPTLSWNIEDKDVNDYLSYQKGYNGYYYLVFNKGYDATLNGAIVTLKITTQSTLPNGNIEYADASINLTIVEYVIHSVSVTNSKVRVTQTNREYSIYGDYGFAVDLEFYFNPTDISYYAYNQDVYYDKEITSGTKGSINNILKEFNDGFGLTLTADETIANLADNKLTVYKDGAKLNLSFALNLQNNCFAIKKSEDSDIVKFNIDYQLMFQNATSDDKPVAILTAQDFVNIKSGTYYILANDITLTDYTPIDVDIACFDGNGHTITINSFATFNNPQINAGLFASIKENMLVMNVNVEYKSIRTSYGGWSLGYAKDSNASQPYEISYADLCLDEVDYESVLFGGLTPINEGIITNCSVSGLVAFSASIVESKVDNYEIAFNIGGLVGENSGYITNSVSKLNIFGLANIGGFVYKNTDTGKIASCGFNANNGGGGIYAYSKQLTNSIITHVAGFVVENNGQISMSYVEVEKNHKNIAKLSAKDESAGFVYNNVNDIKDCYVNMTSLGASQNIFNGFVKLNAGTISTCYSFVNGGNKNGKFNLFCPNGTSGIENCIEFITTKTGYQDVSSNLKTETTNDRKYLLKSTYEPYGFVFGDNQNAVWTVDYGTPKLVSTLDNVKVEEYEYSSNYYNNLEVVDKYYGLRTILKVKEDIVDKDNHVTTTYSYITLEHGYGTKNNPYVIYDVNSWYKYMVQDKMQTGYYRLVADIDFSALTNNLPTTEYTFSGNLQGNNMTISGIMIYSQESLSSIGLFKEIVNNQKAEITAVIKNINIESTSILASKTSMVGVLAGLIDGYKLYNITVGCKDVILGSNAVGGIAGVIRGDFDMDGVNSAVSVNAVGATYTSKYALYLSKNNSASVSQNISDVHYAGAIAGILDGYDKNNLYLIRNLALHKYFEVKNATVNGDNRIIGEIVGGMFGFVGERVRIGTNSKINLTGDICGLGYAGLAVGENRGVILGLEARAISTAFDNTSGIIGGIVGLNINGWLDGCNAYASIIKLNSNNIVGGIVGKNVGGYVYNSNYRGELFGFIMGGIIGVDYKATNYKEFGDVSTPDVIIEDVTYEQSKNDEHIVNVTVSNTTIDYWQNHLSQIYKYRLNEKKEVEISCYRLLGVIVGLYGDDLSYNVKIEVDDYWNWVFNGDNNNVKEPKNTSITDVQISSITAEDKGTLTNITYYYYNENLKTTYIWYLCGAKVANNLDYWNRSVGEDGYKIVFTSTNLS